ncbi:MAG: hypothetical protein JJ975_03895 [Bacteroidia bacterium]|nr:hypothetical protein [Bacteroidia bacterium]
MKFKSLIIFTYSIWALAACQDKKDTSSYLRNKIIESHHFLFPEKAINHYESLVDLCQFYKKDDLMRLIMIQRQMDSNYLNTYLALVDSINQEGLDSNRLFFWTNEIQHTLLVSKASSDYQKEMVPIVSLSNWTPHVGDTITERVFFSVPLKPDYRIQYLDSNPDQFNPTKDELRFSSKRVYHKAGKFEHRANLFTAGDSNDYWDHQILHTVNVSE